MGSHQTESGTRSEGQYASIDQDGHAHVEATDNSMFPDAPTTVTDAAVDGVVQEPAPSGQPEDAQEAATTTNLLFGAPVARHDNFHHSNEPPDGPLSVDGRSLDVVSVASAAEAPRDGADDVQQPYQPAQLATEQDLEPDVRRIPYLLRRRKRCSSKKCLTKYVYRLPTRTPHWAATRGSLFV